MIPKQFLKQARALNAKAAQTVSRKHSVLSKTAPASSLKLPDFVLDTPATDLSKTPNGVRVASEFAHGETATIGVWIDVGSRNETKEENGVAHFLEHMCFKGTSKISQEQLEKEVEYMGAQINAYTSREQTVYYTKVFKKDIPRAMEILSDILQHPTIDENAVIRERDVIMRELEEVEKQAEEVVFDRLHETAFQDQSLGRTILGKPENIQSITKQHLEGFIAKNYTAPRFVIAGAGAIDHSQLTELADKHFGNLPTKSPNTISDEATNIEPAVFTGSENRLREDSIPLAHVAVAFEGLNWTDPKVFSLMIMQTLLGSWDRTSGSGANMASKLCQTVAERQAAHSVMAFNTSYKDTGLFGIYGITDPFNAQELTWIMMESMVNLVHNTTEEEVDRARTQLKSTLLSQLDGSTRICEDIGRQMLTYNRRLTPAETFARIDAISAADVRATADLIINDQDVAVSALGSIHEVPDYNFIRRRSYWLRT